MKLDIGCGRVKKKGYFGVDIIPFPEVDLVLNVGKDAWPWPDESVEDVYCAHMVEHLEASERIHFVNELHRVLKKGKGAWIQVPYWASCRAYGDLTHKWPPVTEFWPMYLDKSWREKYAPHDDFYTCDFSHRFRMAVNEDFKENFKDLVNTASLFVNGIDDLIIELKKR